MPPTALSHTETANVLSVLCVIMRAIGDASSSVSLTALAVNVRPVFQLLPLNWRDVGLMLICAASYVRLIVTISPGAGAALKRTV